MLILSGMSAPNPWTSKTDKASTTDAITVAIIRTVEHGGRRDTYAGMRWNFKSTVLSFVGIALVGGPSNLIRVPGLRWRD